MAFWTYILYSDKTKRFYTGQTNDFDARIYRHNKSLVKSTKSGVPWKIVFSKNLNSRSESVLLELKIKKRGAKRFLNDLEN